MDDNVVEMVERRSNTNVRKMCHRVRWMQEWRTLHDIGLQRFRVNNVQTLQPVDYTARVEFCRWHLQNQQPQTKMLFTDEAEFNMDGITYTQNAHVWLTL
jgi:hypothetical protein